MVPVRYLTSTLYFPLNSFKGYLILFAFTITNKHQHPVDFLVPRTTTAWLAWNSKLYELSSGFVVFIILTWDSFFFFSSCCSLGRDAESRNSYFLSFLHRHLLSFSSGWFWKSTGSSHGTSELFPQGVIMFSDYKGHFDWTLLNSWSKRCGEDYMSVTLSVGIMNTIWGASRS